MNEKKKATLAAPDNSDCKDTQKNDCGAKSDLVSKELNDFDKGLDTDEAKELEKLRIRNSDEIPDPEPIIERDGMQIFSKGDFSILSGLPKSGKTFLCLAIAAAFFKDGGYLGFDFVGEKGTMLWIDTEQGKNRAAQNGRRLNKILGLPEKENVDNFILLDFRELNCDDRKTQFQNAIVIYKPKFVILDGLADLIDDPNDQAKSNDVVSLLMQLSSQYNTHILAVVHYNSNNLNKARGHLGSEAERKCETAILCKAEEGITNCSYTYSRNKQAQNFSFQIIDEIPTLCEYSPKSTNKAKELENLFSDLLTNEPKTKYSDLVFSIQRKIGVTDRTAKSRIGEAIKMKIIAKDGNGLHYLLPKQEGLF